MPVRRLLSCAAALCVLVLALAVPPARARTQPATALTTPERIERAVERGRIGRDRGRLYRAQALLEPGRVPASLRGEQPYDATIELRALRRELPRMQPGPLRREVAALLAPPNRQQVPDLPPRTCDVLSITPLPDQRETDHFYIEYDALLLGGGLTIDDYADSLETAWTTEVGAFSWPAPPVLASNPPPNGKYHVRIDALGPLLYGFVSSVGTHAGFVGDNPSTGWNDQDAYASCMGLNQDYSTFPGSPRQALDATTGHEFHHSLQFGLGALDGANTPEDHFVEGTASWMEDEVFDGADDNRNYLYPAFDDSMGEHEGDIYAYWLTFRGLTERFGANVAGGAEDVLQDFYESISREEGGQLDVLDAALAARATSLPQAFHDYAVAAGMMQSCGSRLALPFCFEEAAGYRAAAGDPGRHAAIASVPATHDGEVEDAYAIQWIALPGSGAPYAVNFENTGAGGAIQATVVCPTSLGGQSRTPLPPLGPGDVASAPSVDPSACSQPPLAVVTSASHTEADPDSPPMRPFRVVTAAQPATRTLTVSRAGEGAGTVTSDPDGIDCGTTCAAEYPAGTEVTLTATPAAGSRFAGWGGACSGTGTCTVTLTDARSATATFEPDAGDGGGTGTGPSGTGGPDSGGSATGTTPPPPSRSTTASDRTAPRVRVLGRKKVRTNRRGRRIRLRIRCADQPGSGCAGTVRAVAKRRTGRRQRIAVGERAFGRIPHGARRTVKVRLDRRGRALLRRRGRLELVLKLRVRDDIGNARTQKIRIKVRRR